MIQRASETVRAITVDITIALIFRIRLFDNSLLFAASVAMTLAFAEIKPFNAHDIIDASRPKSLISSHSIYGSLITRESQYQYLQLILPASSPRNNKKCLDDVAYSASSPRIETWEPAVIDEDGGASMIYAIRDNYAFASGELWWWQHQASAWVREMTKHIRYTYRVI